MQTVARKIGECLPDRVTSSAVDLTIDLPYCSDCYWSQKCIDNGKEPSFCAQLWVDDLPKPGEKTKGKKKKPTPTHHLNPSSLAPSSMLMGPTMLAPSSMVMAPPMQTPKKETPAATPKAMPPKQQQPAKLDLPQPKNPPKVAEPAKESPKKEQTAKKSVSEPTKSAA